MLRKCSKNEFEQYIDFASQLATDLTKSGYPTCCDGIKTKDWFFERSLKAFERDDEEMLIFEQHNEVLGLIHYYWIPEDRYLSTVSFNIKDNVEQALTEFYQLANYRFPDYELYLGFPEENIAVVKFLRENGFELIEDDYNNTAFLNKRTKQIPDLDIARINQQNYDLFRQLHCQMNAEMYWTTDRIWEALDGWHILALTMDGEAKGAVYYTKADEGWYEIFGIDMKDGKFEPEIFRKLLDAALNEAVQSGAQFMTFFCEAEEKEIVKEAGFECIGRYLCFKKQIAPLD